MKIPNKNGTTPKLLLDALHKLMAVEESDDSDSESDETTDTAQAVIKYITLFLTASETKGFNV